MENLFVLLIYACIILLITGFFNPRTSLFWYKQERTKKKSATIYSIAILAFFIIFGVTHDKESASSAKSDSAPLTSRTEESTNVAVGQVLHTTYFDVTVNSVSLNDKVNTGNEFADLPPGEGNKYLIINTSFKNSDNESRMLVDGSVWVNYNGKDYQFDKSETVMLDGWGLLLEQINPLTTKTTNLVYKLPNEIKGDAYWQPGRAESNQRIFLGNLE